jgi:hypothetical protein
MARTDPAKALEIDQIGHRPIGPSWQREHPVTVFRQTPALSSLSPATGIAASVIPELAMRSETSDAA